tara:strand:- start:111 stop:248 length:138 start_codon:yes stop_codon:yes gene_type:complete
MSFDQWFKKTFNKQPKDIFWYDLVTVYLDQYKRETGEMNNAKSRK